MSRIQYNRYSAGSMTIEVDGLDDVVAILGDLRKKTPAVTKTAINATARQARKLMIAKEKARYAVNSAGQKHLKDLVQRKKASNGSLSAELHVASMRNDLGYFKTSPPVPTHFTSDAWRQGPDVWKGKVLKASPMKTLPGEGNKSKAFLAAFQSGHVGMVQRIIGSESEYETTKNGHRRWRNKAGKVEKLVTLGSPSITAMHTTIWPEVEPEVELYLAGRLVERAEQILERAKRRV